MDEDVMLHVYRKSWDDFLEAYKERLHERDLLVGTINDILETDRLTKAQKQKVTSVINEILEKNNG